MCVHVSSFPSLQTESHKISTRIKSGPITPSLHVAFHFYPSSRPLNAQITVQRALLASAMMAASRLVMHQGRGRPGQMILASTSASSGSGSGIGSRFSSARFVMHHGLPMQATDASSSLFFSSARLVMHHGFPKQATDASSSFFSSAARLVMPI